MHAEHSLTLTTSDDYLDNRTFSTDQANVGCLPQWSIKFTKKTVVRISYDSVGPTAFFNFCICKNHGKKYDQFKNDDCEIVYSATNSPINGIEYQVNDFDEPYTIYLSRCFPKTKGPTNYRILIESPDTDFIEKKFDDNFIQDKWNSASYQGMFASPEKDYWNPYSEAPLRTCKQWYLRFPNLKKNEKADVRIQFFKNLPSGPITVLLAKTDKTIGFILTNLEFQQFEVHDVSDYEEFIAVINGSDDNNNNYIFCPYREKEEGVTQFKFIIWSKSKFEFGLMPEPDPLKDCGYSISGQLKPGQNDGVSPYNPNKRVNVLKQWCLVFKKSPTTVYVDYNQKNAKSQHSFFLEKKEKKGEKMDVFYQDAKFFELKVKKNVIRDRATWTIDDIASPYSFCVTREPSNDTSDWNINIFADNDFEMNEITDDEKVGKSAPKYKNIDNKIKPINFPQIKQIEQPSGFSLNQLLKKNQNASITDTNKTENVNSNANADAKTRDSNKNTQNNDQEAKRNENNDKEQSKSKCCLLI